MSSYSSTMAEAVAITERAAVEGRELNAAELGELAVLTQRAEAERNRMRGGVGSEADAKSLYTSGAASAVMADGSVSFGAGYGDQFIQSHQYKSLFADGATRGQQWSTGAIELYQTKGTLVAGAGSALVPPQYQPGIVETLYQPLGLADLLGQDVTTASQIRYVVESAATNAAAGVLETGLKPESAFTFSEVVEPVRKVATVLPVSDETLEDSSSIRAYLNGRLALFVSAQEEAQLLLGSGSPGLQGLVASGRAIGTFVRSAGTSNADAILRAAVACRGSSYLEPDTLVINPLNWQTIRLGTDTSGQYYGGGPFGYGPYGAGAATPMFGASIWGLRVFVSSSMTFGTALIGNFRQGAAVVRRKAIPVEVSNSHSTYFASNISTLRAESRLALACYRPGAFTAITSLT